MDRSHFLNQLTAFFRRILFKRGLVPQRARFYLFLVLIAPVVIVSGIGYLTASEALTRVEVSRKASVVALSATLIQQKLTDTVNLGVALATRVKFVESAAKGDWQGAIELLGGVKENFPFIERIFLTDPKATIVADMPTIAGAIDLNRAETDWYQGVRKDWTPYVSGVFKRVAVPRYSVVNVAIPIKADIAAYSTGPRELGPQRILGILVLQLKLDVFAKWVAPIKLEPGERIFLVDQKGQVIFHPNHDPQGEILDLSADPTVKRLLSGQFGVLVERDPIEKEQHVEAFKRVDNFGWGVVLTQPARIAFVMRDKRLASLLLVFCLFLAGITFLALFILHLLKLHQQASDEVYDLFNNAPCGYHSLNKDGGFVRINDTELRWLGRTREEVVGKMRLPDMLTPASLQTFREEFPRFLEQGWVRDTELELVRKDGSVFPVLVSATAVKDEDGHFVMSRSTIFDITDRRRAEAALAGSKEYLARIIDSIGDPVFVKDARHRWVSLNRAFCAFMGRRLEELLGKSDYDFFPKEQADVFWAKDEEVFRSGEENINEEFFTDARGEVKTIITKKTVYVDLEGNKFIVGVIRDISQRKVGEEKLAQAYRDLQLAQEKLVQSEKLAAIGQLAAGVAHEINNPMGFISSNLQVLEQHIATYSRMFALMEKLKDAVENKADGIVKSVLKDMRALRDKTHFDLIATDLAKIVKESQGGVERIQRIVADLRTFAREDREIMGRARIEGIIDGILGIVQHEIKYRAELKKNYGKTPVVNCSAVRMGQVFVNLLTNAAHATKDKGVIRIKTYEKDGYVCVDISDNGCGIPPEQISRVFDPFFTTKPVGHGTG
ncbi:MAG: PAS domain S-box protein, partial [Candidatus Omnitrophica bacterium]|nr:PAS domain S-box protein [Candidatus Omnitrophota bacterium]